MGLLAHEDPLKNPRCQIGAKVSNGKRLFEIVDTRTSGSTPETRRAWVRVEDCATLVQNEVEAKFVLRCDLVQKAPLVPDYAPEALAA